MAHPEENEMNFNFIFLNLLQWLRRTTGRFARDV